MVLAYNPASIFLSALQVLRPFRAATLVHTVNISQQISMGLSCLYKTWWLTPLKISLSG